MKYVALLLFALCGITPYNEGDYWIKEATNPVMEATLEWERGAVFEPSVLRENGVFRMWYSGGTTNCSVGYAESIDGVNWVKHGEPVINGACRNSVMRDGNTLYMTFSRFTPDQHDSVWLATSFNGIEWVLYPDPILETNELFTHHANTTLWRVGQTWHLRYESHAVGGYWHMAETTSEDVTRFENAAAPLSSLQITNGASYGGSAYLNDTHYYHASPISGYLPTQGYQESNGAPRLILPISQRWFEHDQVADLHAVDVRGETWLYYSGCDNRDVNAVTCAIGVAYEPIE